MAQADLLEQQVLQGLLGHRVLVDQPELVLQVLPDLQDRAVPVVLPGLQVRLARVVHQDLQAQAGQPELESQVQLVHQGHQVRLAPQVPLALELREQPVPQAHPDLVGRAVQVEPPVLVVQVDPRVQVDQPAQALREQLVPLDLPVRVVLVDPQELQALQAPLDLLVRLDPLELALQALQVPVDLRVHPVRQDLRVLE